MIRRAPVRTRQTRRTRCHEWTLPDGTRWASIAKGRGEHVLRFRRFAEFIVSEGGRSVRWRALAATRPDTIRHLLLDQVMPALASEHSLIGLHASAVVVDGQGIAFAGPASRGKSTLAASFALDGHAVVTDDCLMLQWKRRVAARGAELSVASIVEGYGRSTAWTDARPLACRGIHVQASRRRPRLADCLPPPPGRRTPNLLDRTAPRPGSDRPPFHAAGLHRVAEDCVSPRSARSRVRTARDGGARDACAVRPGRAPARALAAGVSRRGASRHRRRPGHRDPRVIQVTRSELHTWSPDQAVGLGSTFRLGYFSSLTGHRSAPERETSKRRSRSTRTVARGTGDCRGNCSASRGVAASRIGRPADLEDVELQRGRRRDEPPLRHRGEGGRSPAGPRAQIRSLRGYRRLSAAGAERARARRLALWHG